MKIELKDIRKTYGSTVALDKLTLRLPETRSLILVGPSGGGKSTTLRLMAGLEKPDSGKIFFNGKSLPQDEAERRAYRKSVGIVFQSYNLFPHLDALENIALPLRKVHGVDRKTAEARALELLGRFKLASHARKRPYEMSGGQNQRVAIARAMAHEPEALFFDEPTSALDPEMSAEVLDVIEELIQTGKPCIVVTHQMSFARRAGDHIAFVTKGRISELSTSERFFTNPQNSDTAAFLEKELRY
ncbi:amino acid ABC transporter ATP-binding protein [Pelagicoccus sp. SDUM812003]|uniref:amino acid ABC transporter ATP-binding protein n=1 Tax=Pelagicoccus sp. SDUM812003 TaxID=3041267 RepID=UPI00280C90DC|nr:amino acid ABC transporter ATP-binding protein [Pelagicoccus sp. SDUM812003]MDQ8205355.1 amino acid ABC transporter ATP-binding protein [Pelagicoccus sp. SDUM812003]